MLFACFFGVAWLLFYPLQPVYRGLLTAGLDSYYALRGKNIVFSAAGSEIAFRSSSPPAFEADLSPELVYSNLTFLLALLLATPGLRVKSRATSVAAGLALLYLSHVAFLVTKVEVSLTTMAHPLGGNPAFWSFWDDFFETTGKGLFPVSIWLLLALKAMQGATREPAPSLQRGGQGRNAPCPCGSGKKYKRCCGRAAENS